MKLRWIITAMLAIALLVSAGIDVGKAQWSALSSGYAVTTNWHGEDVPIGQSVTAWAGTTDSAVDGVEFRWLDPSGEIAFSSPPRELVIGSFVTPSHPSGAPEEIIDWGNKNPGITVYYATNTQTPSIIGDWGMQVNFYDLDNPVHTLRGKNSDIIAIRATSFNVIPEVPLGTIVILLSMFGALGVFAAKRKYTFLTQSPA